MTAEVFSFEADTGRILNIVINSLYSQKEIFLRELLSNASDAINKRKFQALTAETPDKPFDGSITITASKKAKTLTISDNGIGLSATEMKETLGTIASSGTRAFLDEAMQQATENADAASAETDQLIGKFGVGFYSAFMVAERIEVISRKPASSETASWTSDGQSGFSIAATEKPLLQDRETGTDIILQLGKPASEYLEKERIAHLVKKYSDHITQPIFWAEPGGQDEQLNTAAALWTRPASEISSEEYTTFYHGVAAAYDTPFATLHNRTEGTLEFTNLLFIPSAAPFDLYDPERKSKLQLFVNRVFITDNADGMVPKWLRFLRGVIDTPDIDLNVSREMLQHSPAVSKIGRAVVRRVLAELKKALEKRRDEYEALWEHLGRVIKEGLYEDEDNRAKILELCLFRSSGKAKPVTLREYIEGFAKGQEEIYYITMDDATRAASSPHLESFSARGIEVLILSDPIDDFWLSKTPDFEQKPFRSVTRGEVDLSAIGESTDAETDTPATLSEGLVARMKSALGAEIADIRGSVNMETSLARLVTDENGLDPQMERMMRLHNPAFTGGPKILEINSRHPLVKTLDERLQEGSLDDAEDYAKLIRDSAVIAEGETIDDAGDFTARLASLMQKALTK